VYKLCFYVPVTHLEEVKSAVMAMQDTHPYEQPAWDGPVGRDGRKEAGVPAELDLVVDPGEFDSVFMPPLQTFADPELFRLETMRDGEAHPARTPLPTG